MMIQSPFSSESQIRREDPFFFSTRSLKKSLTSVPSSHSNVKLQPAHGSQKSIMLSPLSFTQRIPVNPPFVRPFELPSRDQESFYQVQDTQFPKRGSDQVKKLELLRTDDSQELTKQRPLLRSSSGINFNKFTCQKAFKGEDYQPKKVSQLKLLQAQAQLENHNQNQSHTFKNKFYSPKLNSLLIPLKEQLYLSNTCTSNRQLKLSKFQKADTQSVVTDKAGLIKHINLSQLKSKLFEMKRAIQIRVESELLNDSSIISQIVKLKGLSSFSISFYVSKILENTLNQSNLSEPINQSEENPFFQKESKRDSFSSQLFAQPNLRFEQRKSFLHNKQQGASLKNESQSDIFYANSIESNSSLFRNTNHRKLQSYYSCYQESSQQQQKQLFFKVPQVVYDWLVTTSIEVAEEQGIQDSSELSTLSELLKIQKSRYIPSCLKEEIGTNERILKAAKLVLSKEGLFGDLFEFSNLISSLDDSSILKGAIAILDRDKIILNEIYQEMSTQDIKLTFAEFYLFKNKSMQTLNEFFNKIEESDIVEHIIESIEATRQVFVKNSEYILEDIDTIFSTQMEIAESKLNQGNQQNAIISSRIQRRLNVSKKSIFMNSKTKSIEEELNNQENENILSLLGDGTPKQKQGNDKFKLIAAQSFSMIAPSSTDKLLRESYHLKVNNTKNESQWTALKSSQNITTISELHSKKGDQQSMNKYSDSSKVIDLSRLSQSLKQLTLDKNISQFMDSINKISNLSFEFMMRLCNLTLKMIKNQKIISSQTISEIKMRLFKIQLRNLISKDKELLHLEGAQNSFTYLIESKFSIFSKNSLYLKFLPVFEYILTHLFSTADIFNHDDLRFLLSLADTSFQQTLQLFREAVRETFKEHLPQQVSTLIEEEDIFLS